MKYKALLLDIDNTLYDYNKSHSAAKRNIVEFYKKQFDVKDSSIILAYDKAREITHIELSETASSHNRLLYIQKMCEILEVNSLKYSLEIYHIYWETFLKNIVLFDGVHDLLKMYKNKICFITDLTAYIQFKKIKKLKLDEYCNTIVTSEEAGKEKPHPYLFTLALNKLNLHTNEVCMIGDSFKKDIIGSMNLNINSIWLNREKKKETYNNSLVKQVSSFKEILELI